MEIESPSASMTPTPTTLSCPHYRPYTLKHEYKDESQYEDMNIIKTYGHKYKRSQMAKDGCCSHKNLEYGELDHNYESPTPQDYLLSIFSDETHHWDS